MQAENLSVAAAFDLSYQDLTTGQQRLFRGLACTQARHRRLRRRRPGRHRPGDRPPPSREPLRSPSDHRARPAAATACTTCSANMLAPWPPPATRRTATPPPACCWIITHTALAAGRHITARTTAEDALQPGRPPPAPRSCPRPGRRPPGSKPSARTCTLPPSHAAARGCPRHAIALPSAMGGFLRAHGHWDQAAALHQAALTVHARPVTGAPRPAPWSSSASWSA